MTEWPPSLHLLLLPGLDGTGKLFAPLKKAIPSSIQTTTISYPSNLTAYEELVDLVRDQLPQNEPILIAAESFSGPIAHSLAAKEPERIRGIFLCASFLFPPRPGLLQLARFTPLSLFCSIPPPRWAVRHFCLGRSAKPKTIDLFYAAIRDIPASVIATRIRMLGRLPLEPEPVQTPARYLRAESDRLIPTSSAKRAIKLLPNLTITSIPGPHFLLQAEPEAAWEALFQFATDLAC